MENKNPKFLSEIAQENYLQYGPKLAMKMLKKDLDKLLLRIDNNGRREADADYTDIDAEGLENLEIIRVAIVELLHFGFRRSDVARFGDFSKNIRNLIFRIQTKNKILSKEWIGELDKLLEVLEAKPKIAQVDPKLQYPGAKDLVKEFRGVVGLAALSVLAAMAIKSVPPAENSESNKTGIHEIAVRMPNMPQQEDGDVTVVSAKNGVYSDNSGVAHKDKVVSNDYGDKEYLVHKKSGPEYEKAVSDFRDKVKEAFQKGTLIYENFLLEGEFVVGDVSPKKHEKALEVSKEIDKDFVDVKNMKPLDFFKKVAEIVQSPVDDADYRNKNANVTDAYSDPDRIAACKARNGARGSKIQKLRPDLMKHVSVQLFGDHARTVVLYEGKLYSLDGSHQFDLELDEVLRGSNDDAKKKIPNFQLLEDPDEVKGSVFMSFDDYYVRKFLGDKIDSKKILANSRQILQQAGFDPNLIDEHTDVADNRDLNYVKNDVFGADDVIPGLSNYGASIDGVNHSDIMPFLSAKGALKYFKLPDPDKDRIGGMEFDFGEDIPEWPSILESLQQYHYLKKLSFNFEHVADDSMYVVEDEKGDYSTVVHGSNPLPAYEKNSVFAEGLAQLDGVETLNLSKLKNLSPRLLDGIAHMRSLHVLDLRGLDSIPDYFWKMLPEFKNLYGLHLRIADINKDFNFEHLREISSHNSVVLNLDNANSVTDWGSLVSGWDKKSDSNINIRNIGGIDKFDDDFVSFLLSMNFFLAGNDVLSGTYSYKDLTEKGFLSLLTAHPNIKFDNSEVYLAYWKRLVAMKGTDKAMEILNIAVRDYYKFAEWKGKIPRGDQSTKYLDDLGINGSELVDELNSWKIRKAYTPKPSPSLPAMMPDVSKLPKKSSN